MTSVITNLSSPAQKDTIEIFLHIGPTSEKEMDKKDQLNVFITLKIVGTLY